MATSAILTPEDANSVLALVLLVSGYAAQERGSSAIEPRDLLKAIYIVDLEHVQAFWEEWEDFERFVSGKRLAEAGSGYINRTVYLVRVEIDLSQAPGGYFRGVGNLSEVVRGIIGEARMLASNRTGNPSTPSSRDLLFSICTRDPSLSKALQDSGLNIESLTQAVRRTGKRPGGV